VICERCKRDVFYPTPRARRACCYRCGRMICTICRIRDFGRWWCADLTGRTPRDCKEEVKRGARRAGLLPELPKGLKWPDTISRTRHVDCDCMSCRPP